MNEKQFIKNLAENIVEKLKTSATNTEEQGKLTRELFDEVTNILLKDQPDVTHLSAPNGVIEIIDTKNKHLYRRYLELAYDETGNGLRLLGDDIGGNPVQIVFLSNSALEQLNDLHGAGPDNPRCDH
ncbi:hypothetical protein M2454_001690 [Aequitasia blattaphilus]|uniref:Uncharacterized protein n=1 Tax=Aequitasia blattaphilus TaxID=2949332 RepID=A0ABT1E8E0_9FIRM|nr:hypothetical protein [Aequitasia blattaphilus]MCP1102090.1 hypothetical protein [Aequitasia blattaphilus]MCR8614730.1 hypothetical protein [Aequitasia blattaphilus]